MKLEDTIIACFDADNIKYMLYDDPDMEQLKDYIEGHDLEDEIILACIRWMRDWYDNCSGDAEWDALNYALKRVIGEEKARELRWW